MKRYYDIFVLHNFFCWRRSKCNTFSHDLLKTYAIFLHQHRQLSWWLYAFERDTQFWYTWQLSWWFDLFDRVMSFLHQDMQVFRPFYDLNKISNFYWVDVLHFLCTLLENSTRQRSTPSLARNKKIENCQQSTYTKILWWPQFPLQFL